jgi:hypothetical protein
VGSGRLVRSFPVSVASIDDLISMKRISARPRDAEDIAALEELKRANEQRKK